MRRILCVRLLSWPTDRVKRRRPALRERPLALIAIGRRPAVAAACVLAKAGGVREGMTLAEASALCAGLAHRPYDARQDARALEGLGRWMMARFSPQVAVQPPDAIFAEIGGSVRLLGGLDVIARQVALAMRWLRIGAHLAVAPTAGAAWALAAAGRQRIIDESETAAALDPLPVAALRIDPAIADALHHVGIATIGQLMRLPRSALPARFGPTLLERLDHATGRLPEPMDWLAPRSPVRERMTFEGLIDSLEAVWAVLEKLVSTIVAELSRRGCGARRLCVRFEREKPPALVQSITLSRPTRQAKGLLELLRLSTETLRTREGFIAIELAVPELQRMTDEQASFAADESADGAVELAGLVDRVRARLGESAVVRPRLIASHVPERAFAWSHDADGPPTLAVPPRPMALLPRPVEIGVVVTPSDDREGRPVSFTHAGRVHRLRFAVGPERIAGEWWTGHNKTRDYFDVEDETGRRFWVFRVAETSKWYLHGTFE